MTFSQTPTRMIVLDIDGTIMPSSGTRMSERTQNAIRRADAAGVHIVIATGRRQAYAMPLLEQLLLHPSTVMISSNGTVTRTFGGKSIDRWLLPVDTARALCGELRQFGGSTVFTFDREGPGELVVDSLEDLQQRVELWVESNRPYIREVKPLERAFDGGEAPVQGMVCGSVEGMRRAEERLNESCFAGLIETHRTEYPAKSLSILDILPPGCSKGSAIERLAASLGVRRSQIMAIGDNYNDVEMLKYVGQPVLMGNAPPELLDMAGERNWSITATNDEDGVALSIFKALERNRAHEFETEENADRMVKLP